MKPRCVTWGMLLILAAVVAISCGRADRPAATRPGATQPGSEAASKRPSQPAVAPASQPRAATSSTLAALDRYLCENFGGLAEHVGKPPKKPDYATSWFPYITSLEIKEGAQLKEVWVSTSLYPDADAIAPARAICSAVSGFGGIHGVRVAAKDGQRLVYRRGLGEKCE